MCFVLFLCVSEVEVVMPFCSFLYLSMAGMLFMYECLNNNYEFWMDARHWLGVWAGTLYAV